MSDAVCLCGAEAKWHYCPDDGGGERQRDYCDDCVLRGCSCNIIIDKDGNYTTDSHKDKQGRDLPCCEYDYLPFQKDGTEP